MDGTTDCENIEDAKCEVTFSSNKTRAFMTLTPPANGGRPPDMRKIAAALSAAGVSCGVNESTVINLSAFPKYGKPIVIAEALMPVHGESARLEYTFTPTGGAAPKLLPDGSVDYKELGILTNVRAGDVLCRKIPATPGHPGEDVTGGLIPARPGPDLPLPKGRNTAASEDNLALIAVVDGQVDLVNEKIQVNNVYVVKGDVDYETGNIEFVGNVEVWGDVKQGFTVKAEGNISVKGSVEGGFIKAGGNVFIQQGFNGMNRGFIECDGDLSCRYIQNGAVTANYKIQSDMIIKSMVKCGANVRLTGQNAAIVASSVTARYTIDCKDIGAPNSSTGSTLEVGSDPYISARNAAIPLEQEEINKNLANLERTLLLFKQLAAANRLDNEKKAKLEQVLAARKQLQDRLADLLMEKQKVEQILLAVGYGSINVRGKAYAGTTIVIGSHRKNLTSDYQFTKFSRSESGILTGPAVSDA